MYTRSKIHVIDENQAQKILQELIVESYDKSRFIEKFDYVEAHVMFRESEKYCIIIKISLDGKLRSRQEVFPLSETYGASAHYIEAGKRLYELWKNSSDVIFLS